MGFFSLDPFSHHNQQSGAPQGSFPSPQSMRHGSCCRMSASRKNLRQDIWTLRCGISHGPFEIGFWRSGDILDGGFGVFSICSKPCFWNGQAFFLLPKRFSSGSRPRPRSYRFCVASVVQLPALLWKFGSGFRYGFLLELDAHWLLSHSPTTFVIESRSTPKTLM